jgi:predicted GIY-YIG superfamily endonuclease
MTDTQSTPVVNPVEILYRLRAANGDLLYVGITRDWPARMVQHQRDKGWFDEVRITETVHIDGTRAQIEAIERAVIKTESPRFNKQHNTPAPAPEKRVKLGARAERLPLGRKVICAIGAWNDEPATWQVNEHDGTCVLLAKVGDLIHYEDLGWGQIESIEEGGLWLTAINFGVGEGVHRYSLADPHLREAGQDEVVDDDHLHLEDSIGRLFKGSYCHHQHFGHGIVTERDGQMRFLVNFPHHGSHWIDRTDMQVVRWGQ